jgi:membrane-associated phospholipid phosphatase
VATLATRARSETSPGRISVIRASLLLPGLLALGTFFVLAFVARNSGPLPGDVQVERFAQSVAWGPVTTFFGWITAFNGPTQLTAGLIVLTVVIAINPRTFFFSVLAALSGPLYTVSNSLVDRPRPSGALVQVTEHLGGHSFPSGHAVFALTYVSLLVLCVGGKYLPRRWLYAAAVAGAAVVLFMSAARLATGGHWPTDVYGSLLLGGGWLLLLLSFRPIGNPVLAWLGDPTGAWKAHHPSLSNTFESRRKLVAHAMYTPIVQVFERLGFAVRGILWIVIGGALAASVFQLGQHFDLYDSVRFLISDPWRWPMVILIVLAIGGYALWGYVRTIFDPLQRGRSVSGLVARMGFLSSAISYTLVAAFAFSLGFTNSFGSGTTPIDPVAALNVLAAYGAVYVVGTIVVAIGISQAIDGWREPFKHDVLTEDAPHGFLFHLWTSLGRVGLWARAVLFAFLGVLIVVEHAGGLPWSTDFSHAFMRMDHLPGGSAAAVILGLGLVALGLHSVGSARWMRLRPPVIPARA